MVGTLEHAQVVNKLTRGRNNSVQGDDFGRRMSAVVLFQRERDAEMATGALNCDVLVYLTFNSQKASKHTPTHIHTHIHMHNMTAFHCGLYLFLPYF